MNEQEQDELAVNISREFDKLAKYLDGKLPSGRERSLVGTKVEEAMFWALAAVARQ